jgi:hypothetical protein
MAPSVSQPAPSKKTLQYKNEEFLLSACLKLRVFLDTLKTDAATYFDENAASAHDTADEKDDAYMAFEDLLIENLQVEINEAFDIADADDSGYSDGSSYGDYSSSEESESEEMDETA